MKVNRITALLAAILFLSQTSHAARIGADTVDIGKRGSSANKTIRMGNGRLIWNQSEAKLKFSNDGGSSVKNIGAGAGGSGGVNLLVDNNADFESAFAGSWTASGGALTAETGSPLFGSQSANFDASASGQNVDSVLKAVPVGLESNECLAGVKYSYPSGSSGDYKLQALNSGGTVLSEADLPTTTSAQDAFVVFTCPSSDSVRMRVTSTADGAAIVFDEAHLGSNIYATKVGGSKIAGVAFFPTTASCDWSRTSATIGAFSTTAACPAPTIEYSASGSWQTIDSDLPQITINNLPPSVCRVTATVNVTAPTDQRTTLALSDGTNTRGIMSMLSPGNNDRFPATVIAVFNYNAVGNRTFAIHGAASAGTVLIGNSVANERTTFTVDCFPLNADSAIEFDKADWRIDAFITGASNLNKTTTTGGYVEWADAGLTMTLASGSAPAQIGCTTGTAPEGLTCNTAAVNESVAVAFTPPWAGDYEVCARYNLAKNIGTGGDISVRNKILETGLTNQTLQGSNQSDATASSLVVSSTAPTIEDHDGYETCATMQFSSSSKRLVRLHTNITGVQEGADLYMLMDNALDGVRWTVRPVNRQMTGITFANAVSTGTATGERIQRASVSGGNPPIVEAQSGNWITFNTRTGAGDYTFNVTGFSAPPQCVCSSLDGNQCTLDSSMVAAPSASSIRIKATGPTGAGADAGFHILCMGQK